ncbi:hypothetical protein [Kribbella sp. NPDC000426]|uniref:hypothetical protein n=1 Tax=Kribbella sp. NPDC000426 TaxID=3154255 RepID=UPI0033335007
MTQDDAVGRGRPVHTLACHVPISEWQYYLIQPDQDPVVPDPSLSDGFVATAGGGVFVTAATESGGLSLTVEVHTTVPPVRLDAWEDVSELSLQLSEAPLLVCGFGFVPVVRIPFDDDSAGAYRLRIHGTNRDLAHSRGPVPGEPEETHLIQLWRAADQPALTLKQASAFSRMMRPR